jgi:zinc protease
MAVVGDISVAEVDSLLEQYFSSWHSAEVAVPPSLYPHVERKRETVTVDKDLTQATIKLGHVGVSRNNPDYYAVSVMNYILGGGGFASRLMLNIREEKGLVYDIHSFFAADRYGGSFQVGLSTKNESANVAIEEVLKELKRMKTELVSEEDLSDAQSFLTGSFPMRIETSSRIASFLVAVEYYGLGVDYIENYPGYINSVSREDVLRVAQEYLDPERFVLVVVADQNKTNLRKEFH